MAENLIFAEQELAFASVEELGGAYAHDFESGNQFTMAVGQTYRIVWDGEPWDAVAWDASAYVDDTIGVGNAALLGLSGTNEPFLIAWSPNGTVILSYDAEASHRIAIYQVVEEETFLVVKKSSMKSVADSIRAKAGVEGDLEWPAGYKAAIEGITGSGGASDDVRYVTFMSHDGSVEYGKKAVAVGDDCADPIARGIFDTPTRESDVQYNYTFYGWADTPNGAANSNWNKSITEDKTVYANFISAVRYYTITYYDGDTVLKTESIAYGSTPSYKPAKEGHSFDGWNPEVTTVTGDASYTAKWVEKVTFANGSWADISRIAEAGEASEYFAVGDMRTISIDGNPYEMEIVAFDHDDKADGSGKAGITCVCTDAYGTRSYNSSSSAIGWDKSGLRSFCNDTLYAKFDAELQSVIKQVTKRSYTGGSVSIVSTDDYCWVLSSKEIGGSIGSGTKYDRFTSLAYANIGKTFWLRDADSSNKRGYYLTASSKTTTGSMTAAHSVRFGFCI